MIDIRLLLSKIALEYVVLLTYFLKACAGYASREKVSRCVYVTILSYFYFRFCILSDFKK